MLLYFAVFDVGFVPRTRQLYIFIFLVFRYKIQQINRLLSYFLHPFSGDWWAGYGYEIPTLQRAAIRILNQPCSSHWCLWNWTSFESIHNKNRNREEMEKLKDLAFVHCNMWLQGICQSRGGKCKPVIFDEIDVSSEWPTELDPSVPLLDDSWLDNLPFDSRTIPWRKQYQKNVCMHVCMYVIMYDFEFFILYEKIDGVWYLWYRWHK